MSFKLSNFYGDPFAIATVSFGIMSWIIGIAGAGSAPDVVSHFTWWALVYQIIIVLVVLLLYLFNTLELYKFTLVGLLSVAFVYTTNATNNQIYRSSSGSQCCAAGCILSSILNVIWIVYFGGHPESPTNQFVDSFSLRSHTHNHGHLASNDNHKLEEVEEVDYKKFSSQENLGNSNTSAHFQDNNLRQSQLTTNNKSTTAPYMSSSQLNGLENFSSSDVRQSRDLTSNKRQTVYNDEGSNNNITFRYKAQALYSYDANPDDINEISFVKDEILDVDDIDGKWWQARKSNGQVGICPSNYVKLLS
ncbi:uncharacterized protein PRCAT00000142001 [Priceomyces carsonii]|uniref:uncharacterized protein n=1 Tax=Priceomyces carsonii TaxID=28549 RepID=UPI002EDAFD80|nr:unnamed protein product [Priceomyces carsonii]